MFARADDPSHVSAADPRDPEFYRDPYQFYAMVHARGPTFRWPAYGLRCFATYADVAALLRDRRFGRQRWRDQPPPPRPGLEAFDALERHSMLELEPPEHTALRRAVNRSFVSRRIAEMAPTIERYAQELIGKFPHAEPFDLLPSLATPIPIVTIADLMGVSRDAGDKLLGWSHAMVAVYAFADDENIRVRANAAAQEFAAFIDAQLDNARERQDATLLSELARSKDLSRPEAISTTILLLNAGHEATVHQIGNAVRTLIVARDGGFDLARSIDDDERLDRLIEECLRIDPPLHLFTRIAGEDISWTDVAGTVHEIAAGEEIALLLGAANHDPRRFPEPSRFDPARASPDHVAFGGGIHFCLGAPLARLELRIALRALFQAYPRLALVEEPVVADTFHFHGLERLMVRAD